MIISKGFIKLTDKVKNHTLYIICEIVTILTFITTLVFTLLLLIYCFSIIF